MSLYSYKAVNAQGKEVRGQVDASSRNEAIGQLRARSLQVLSVEEAIDRSITETLQLALGLLKIKSYLSPGAADHVLLFRQLALLLRSGNTLMQALQLCAEMTERRPLRRALIQIIVDLQGGSGFALAVERQGRLFPPLAAKLIASGEASGELQHTLERLAESIGRAAALRRQFISSLIYPTLVVTAAVGVTLFLALSIVPKFAKLLEGKSQSLPPSTQLMMDCSAWLIDNGWWLGILVGGGLFAILASYTTVAGKRVIDRVMLNLPLVGHSIRSSGMAQMGWTMSLLLGSGLTVLEALRVVSSVVPNDRLARCFTEAGEQILAGRSLASGLRQYHVPMMVQHMAGIGERSGELEQVMQSLGQYYQDQTEARIKRMIAMIEPAMTLVIGGLVGFVYFAFFKAMMQVSAG